MLHRDDRRLSWRAPLARLAIAIAIAAACPRAAAAAPGGPVVTVEPLLGAAAPGDSIPYKVTVRSEGGDGVDSAAVRLWSASPLLTALGRPQDPACAIDAAPRGVTLALGPVDAEGERSAIALFLVAPDAPDDALLTLQARADWRAPRAGGVQPLRVTPVRVVAPGHDAAAVSPSAGTRATTFVAHGDHFLPGEAVVAILLGADGAVVPLPQATASADGSVALAFRGAGAPGPATLVLHGVAGGAIQRAALTIAPG